MSKKRTVSINTGVTSSTVEQPKVICQPNPLDRLNRYLPPHVKYTFDEFVIKLPEKAERIVAHANLSDEALLGYVKTLIAAPVEIIPEQTEEE